MKRLILILSFIFTVVSLSSCREEQEHQHIYSAQWQTSESHHWKRCQDQECDSRIATSEHSFDDIMPLGNGNTKYTCSVCSYKKSHTSTPLPQNIQMTVTSIGSNVFMTDVIITARRPSIRTATRFSTPTVLFTPSALFVNTKGQRYTTTIFLHLIIITQTGTTTCARTTDVTHRADFPLTPTKAHP